jgi:hypothetical protein
VGSFFTLAKQNFQEHQIMSITLRNIRYKFTRLYGKLELGLGLFDDVPELSNAEWQQIIDAALKHDLRWLSFGDNKITAIPELIGALTNLKHLSIRYNPITVIPESIAALTNLERLDLYDSEITAIPKSITILANLTVLSFNRNEIAVIPDSIAALTNLRTLLLGENKIRVIPESIAALTNLKWLSLDRNEISNDPDVIAELINLDLLWLDDNPFINSLPNISKERSVAFYIEYFKQRRVPRMATVALVWKLLPMPIAEEIELHVTHIVSSDEKKYNTDARVENPKRRRINE